MSWNNAAKKKIEPAAKENKGDIADLQAKTYELDQCCNENKSDISTLNSEVTTINGEVATLQG